VDVVFDGAFRGVGDEEVVMGEGVVISSSLDRLTNSCLGGIMNGVRKMMMMMIEMRRITYLIREERIKVEKHES
nr:hypothetical protein [Tanacetum cinerariifolium]